MGEAIKAHTDLRTFQKKDKKTLLETIPTFPNEDHPEYVID